MSLGKYFRVGQKVLLRTVGNSEDQQCEAVTAQLEAVDGDLFTVTVPYALRMPSRAGACAVGGEFYILSETYGLGIQVSGRVEALPDARTLQIRHRGDLEMFFHREHFRIDTRIGLHIERPRSSSVTLRQQWTETTRQLATGGAVPDRLAQLERTTINLSGGGLALPLERPVDKGDLVLVYLELLDGKSPLVALAEVVWTRRPEGYTQMCGLRFAEIAATDRVRINDHVIAELRRHGEDVVWYSVARKQNAG